MASIPKMNRIAVLVPAVEVLGLGEVGVAPEGDLAEPRPAAEGGGLVEVDVGVLVRGPVAAAVDQVQRLGGVGQRDDQRVVAPGPVVGDVHPLLAPAVGGGERAVGVDERLVEEVRRAARFQARSRVSLKVSINCSTSASVKRRQKSPGGGRVGDAFGPEGVEVDLVVAADFEVLQALPPARRL